MIGALGITQPIRSRYVAIGSINKGNAPVLCVMVSTLFPQKLITIMKKEIKIKCDKCKELKISMRGMRCLKYNVFFENGYAAHFLSDRKQCKTK